MRLHGELPAADAMNAIAVARCAPCRCTRAFQRISGPRLERGSISLRTVTFQCRRRAKDRARSPYDLAQWVVDPGETAPFRVHFQQLMFAASVAILRRGPPACLPARRAPLLRVSPVTPIQLTARMSRAALGQLAEMSANVTAGRPDAGPEIRTEPAWLGHRRPALDLPAGAFAIPGMDGQRPPVTASAPGIRAGWGHR